MGVGVGTIYRVVLEGSKIRGRLVEPALKRAAEGVSLLLCHLRSSAHGVIVNVQVSPVATVGQGRFMSAGYSRQKFYGYRLSEAFALLCIDPNLLTHPEHSEHEI
jgi:hypothetical protein